MISISFTSFSTDSCCNLVFLYSRTSSSCNDVLQSLHDSKTPCLPPFCLAKLSGTGQSLNYKSTTGYLLVVDGSKRQALPFGVQGPQDGFNASWSIVANTPCTGCEAGKYKKTTGSANCDECPAGTYLETIGNDALSDCIACDAGKYSSSMAHQRASTVRQGNMSRQSATMRCLIAPPVRQAPTRLRGAQL